MKIEADIPECDGCGRDLTNDVDVQITPWGLYCPACDPPDAEDLR